MKRIINPGPSLFDWADAQPAKPAPARQRKTAQTSLPPAIERSPASAEIVDFIERRETLPRFILCQPAPFAGLDREIARKEGLMPPTPILPFKREA